uniref:C2H2-type domain-containing protein n=1 Tax=Syphacia muris TaxID=451379 RepID=A0A0N5AB99_9BILA
MAFVSGGGGLGGAAGNVPSAASANAGVGIPTIRSQEGRPDSPRTGLPQTQVNSPLVQLQDPTQVLYSQLMTNQFFQNILAQASLLQPAAAPIALANAASGLAAQAVQGAVPGPLLLPNQQLLQFLMNQQLAAQMLQQPQVNSFNSPQPIQLRLSNATASQSQQHQVQQQSQQPQQQLQQHLQQQQAFLNEQSCHNSAHEKLCPSGSPQNSASEGRNVGGLTTAESFGEHINRLITENEAILEQNPGRVKRRNYHKQVGQQSSFDIDSGGRSQSNSPGIAREGRSCLPRQYLLAGGSITNGQPILRVSDRSHSCPFCLLKFNNEAALDSHESRCSKRPEVQNLHLQPSHSSQGPSGSDTPIPQASVISSSSARKPSISSPSPSGSEYRSLKRRILDSFQQHDEEQTRTANKAPKIEVVKQEVVEPSSSIASNTPLSVEQLQRVIESHMVENAVMLSTPSGPVQSVEAQSRIANQDLIREIQFSRVFQTATTSHDSSKPYVLTLTQSSTIQQESSSTEAPRRKDRLRNICNETYTCINRIQPFASEHQGKQSQFSKWPQGPPGDSKFLLYLGSCSTKPRAGEKNPLRYTIAKVELSQMKFTHSSVYDYAVKVTATATAATPVANSTTATEAATATTAASTTTTTASATATTTAATTNFKKPVTESKGIKATEMNSLKQQIVGGYRTDEFYVYVRGRGRGRYVCDRCGIRCKKPSMLKKHLKSHTDIRPFTCAHCNFSFKTKGNLTKHLQSKAHRRKITEQQKESDGVEPEADASLKPVKTDPLDAYDDDDGSSDEEAHKQPEPYVVGKLSCRRFGQENIILGREAHTPPSSWVQGREENNFGEESLSYPKQPHSAPPAFHYSPEVKKRNKVCFNGNKLAEKDASTISDDKVESNDEVEAGRKNQVLSGSDNISTMLVPSSENFLYPASTSNVTKHSSVGAYLVKEEMICKMCGKSFRKPTELSLHVQTHMLEQQSARIRSYQCTECKQTLRSRSLLAKHIEAAHGNIDKRKMEMNDSDVEENTSNISQSPRSFMCMDCNIGFRKHGVLAKHFRSKTHIMKLESLGKLPENALALITRKESGALLNDIDTTDSEKARASLYDIVTSLRESSSLECHEQMVQSPGPPPTTCYGFSSFKRSPGPLPYFCAIGKKSPSVLNGKRSESFLVRQEKRTDNFVNNQRHLDETTSKACSANVWIPPKAELPLVLDRQSIDIVVPVKPVADSSALSDNSSSIRSDEGNSDGAARSESSTPTLRPLTGTAPSPLDTSTRCNFCDVTYDTPFDLQVHLHADHISILDGKDFLCPKKHCGKLYPNRDNLRLHIAAHYRDAANLNCENREDGDVPLTVISDSDSAGLHRRLVGTNSSQHANSAPNHSPGVPEESHTVVCSKSLSTSSDGSTPCDANLHSNNKISKLVQGLSYDRNGNNVAANVNGVPDCALQKQQNSLDNRILALPCSMCGVKFGDAIVLQEHWLCHVKARPHICKVCDAAFTTAEALDTHLLTHPKCVRFTFSGIEYDV